VRQQRFGGRAALYLAAAYVVAMPFFPVVVKYPSVVDPVEKVALLVNNHDSMRLMYLVTYVIFGLVLAVLALALHARLKDGAPAVSWRYCDADAAFEEQGGGAGPPGLRPPGARQALARPPHRRMP
jgi:hypothetical protein